MHTTWFRIFQYGHSVERPPGLSSDVILFTQFVGKIAEEKLGKRSGPLSVP